MLFLHGFGSQKESFFYQYTAFANSYRTTAIDFVGFGKSSPLTAPWGVGEYADWLYAVIQNLGLQKPVIIAHSFGARVAIKLLARYPVASGLIIVGGAGIVKPRTKAYKRQIRAYRFVKRLAPRWAERHFGSEEYRRLSPLQRDSFRRIVNEDLRQEAQKITLPTLLVYGRKDTTTPLDQEGAIFYQSFSNATLCGVDGDHFTFAQYPRTFNTLVERFLHVTGL